MSTDHGSGIRVSHVSKRYGDTDVLTDVSFDIPPGTVTGLLGPNGSGKSTVMRTMVGLTIPDAGTVTFDGSAYRDLPLPGRHVGTLLDPTAHHPGRSVDATIASAAILMDIPLARARDLTASLGLSTVGRRRFGALSLGMKQRVALALALLGQPRYLILDEPMNGLDIDTADWLRRTLIDHARRTGGAVLVSTHLLHELQTFADRIVVVSEGVISHTGAVDDLAAEARATVVAVDADRMRQTLSARGIPHDFDAATQRFTVDLPPRALSEICVAEHLVIDELGRETASISDLYRRLTRGAYRAEGSVLEHR